MNSTTICHYISPVATWFQVSWYTVWCTPPARGFHVVRVNCRAWEVRPNLGLATLLSAECGIRSAERGTLRFANADCRLPISKCGFGGVRMTFEVLSGGTELSADFFLFSGLNERVVYCLGGLMRFQARQSSIIAAQNNPEKIHSENRRTFIGRNMWSFIGLTRAMGHEVSRMTILMMFSVIVAAWPFVSSI